MFATTARSGSQSNVLSSGNLVALHVRWPGNRLDQNFPIDLVLEVEEHLLSVRFQPKLLAKLKRQLLGGGRDRNPELRLRVRLRYCYVKVISDSINILPESKYESKILDGKFLVQESGEVAPGNREGVRRNLGRKRCR